MTTRKTTHYRKVEERRFAASGGYGYVFATPDGDTGLTWKSPPCGGWYAQKDSSTAAPDFGLTRGEAVGAATFRIALNREGA